MFFLFALDFPRHSVVALATHGLIHILTADHLRDVFGGGSYVEAGLMVAATADRLQLLNLLAFGHELHNRGEHGADTGRVKRSHNYDLA